MISILKPQPPIYSDADLSYNQKGYGNPNYIFNDSKKIWIPRPEYISYKRKIITINKILQLAKEANAPIINDSVLSLDDYKGSRSKDNIAILRQFINCFSTLKTKLTFYFYGDNRSQKTTVALATAFEIFNHYSNRLNYINGEGAYNIKYCRMKDILKLYYEKDNDKSYKTAEEKFALNKQYNELMRADLLIIDEAFDKEKAYIMVNEKQNVLDFLDNLKHHVIFISNVRIEDIDNGFGGKATTLRLKERTGQGYLTFEDSVTDQGDLATIDIFSIFHKAEEVKENNMPKEREVPTRIRKRKVEEVKETTILQVSNDRKKAEALIKVLKAKKLKEQGVKTAEIAQNLGYSSASSLGNALRKYKDKNECIDFLRKFNEINTDTELTNEIINVIGE